MLMEMLLKIILVELKRLEKEIYHYIQFKTHKIYKGLHVNYLNGQEDRTCTTGYDQS